MNRSTIFSNRPTGKAITLLLGCLLILPQLSAQVDSVIQVTDTSIQVLPQDTIVQNGLNLDSIPASTLILNDSIKIIQLTKSIDSLKLLNSVLAQKIHRRSQPSAIDTIAPLPEIDSLKIQAPQEAESFLFTPQADSLRKHLIEDLNTYLTHLSSESDSLGQLALELLTVDMYLGLFRDQRFFSCALNPSKADVRIYNQNRTSRRRVEPYNFESLDQLAVTTNQEMIFAMNAGMYEPNRMAKGLLIVNGKPEQRIDTARQGYGNFYMQPNGIFAIRKDSIAVLERTHVFFQNTPADFLYATQSGPMMLWEGKMNPKFNDGSPNRHIRNAVGITATNEVIFVISERRVTFFEISSFLVSQGCTEALYLDGAISQAYMPELGLTNLKNGGHLGPIVVIFKEHAE